MCFTRGRPRHPQSQGCIERANGVLSITLGKWLDINHSTHWSDGLLSVVYVINTRVSSTTKTTPYETMSGTKTTLKFWFLENRYTTRLLQSNSFPWTRHEKGKNNF
ncbi:unnamed protein product [Didymodactylos carnosus]|uniref:Integrase catalytic domain-containing protein n=1 Tax=Didymodactylos carnosus TaxID=1234261 RepID=A0A814JND5_9BILA|nr:unnamed protein product [Didymodactylos carnosus]CAF3810986.1 unnamed protein product [Didymodactylos carnosus]